jgi:histone H3/H4
VPVKETKEPATPAAAVAVASAEAPAPKRSKKSAAVADVADVAAVAAANTPSVAAVAAANANAPSEAEPAAKKPRKATTTASKEAKEGEVKEKKQRRPKSAASSSTAPSTAAEVVGAKDEEDCVQDGNPCIGRYLRALLKRQYGDSTISKDAIYQVQRYVYQFGLHFLVAVKRHLESAKKNTLMMHDMPTCLQRSLSRSSLYQEFANAMSAALTLYYASYQNGEPSSTAAPTTDAAAEEKRKQMWAARAGLSIPPTRTKDFAKQYLEKFRFSQNSITGLTALFEVLAQRIFKLSYEKAQEASRKRISQSDVQVALKEDGELSWLLVEPVVPLI